MKHISLDLQSLALSLAILCRFLTATLSAEPLVDLNTTSKPMDAVFYWLPGGITVSELVRRAGPPVVGLESTFGRHLEYWLADGSVIDVEARDGSKVTRIVHVSGTAWSQLYPVPSLIRLPPEPNHALQRTEAGGTSILYPTFDLASLCR